jgi:hypothetical protein
MGEDYDAKDYQIEIQDSLGTQLSSRDCLCGSPTLPVTLTV